VGLDPASAKQVERLTGLPLRLHSGRGNFMGMHHYLREHELFDGVGAPCVADSVFAEVLPAWAVEELPGAEVLAGCFTVPDGGRGFLWRASVQTMRFGQGRLTLCQFGIGERRDGALGRYVLDALVGWGGRPRPDSPHSGSRGGRFRLWIPGLKCMASWAW
jgi:hypothetical protein